MKVSPVELGMIHTFLFIKMSLMDRLPLMPELNWYSKNGDLEFSGNVTRTEVHRYYNAILLAFKIQSGESRYLTIFVDDMPRIMCYKGSTLDDFPGSRLSMVYNIEYDTKERLVMDNVGLRIRFTDDESRAKMGLLPMYTLDTYLEDDGFKVAMESDKPLMENVESFAPLFTQEYYNCIKEHVGIDDDTTPAEFLKHHSKVEFYNRLLTVVQYHTTMNKSLIKSWERPETRTISSLQAS